MEQRRIEKIEQRLDKLEQQQTEPIKVTIERRETETERILDNHTEMLKQLSTEQDDQSDLLQTIFNRVGTQGTDIAVLKTEMQGARADITSIKATQSDHGELLKEHSQRFERIEATMATKEDISTVKDDIAELKTTQDKHSTLLREQGQKLDLILSLLQKQQE
jgi:hypothetical protein